MKERLIKIKLEHKDKIILSFYNAGSNINGDQKDDIFDRFY